MRLALALGLSLAACSSGTLASLPPEGGAGDSSGVEAGAPDQLAPADAFADVVDASTEAGPCVLAGPTFQPPTGTFFSDPPNGQGVVTLVPPPGFPVGGSLHYTTDGTPPTAASATYSGAVLVTSPLPVTPTTETVTAIAVAPGCVSSSPVAATYTISNGECSYPTITPPSAQQEPRPFLVDLAGVGPELFCYTLDKTTPSCFTLTDAGNASGCGGTSQMYNPASRIRIDSTETDGQGQVLLTVLSCGGACVGPTEIETQSYQLTLAPPYLSSTAGAGAGLPGWDWSNTGAPDTTMSIPGDAGAPYGPFQVQQVGNPPCTSATTCTGPASQLADYVCWSKNATATCACTTPLPLTPATPYATLPATADVQAGDTLSVIACQSSPPVNAPGHYAPSSVVTVQF